MPLVRNRNLSLMLMCALLAAGITHGCRPDSCKPPPDLFYIHAINVSEAFYVKKERRKQQKFMDSVYAGQKCISFFGRLIWLNDKAAFHNDEGRPDSCIFFADQAMALIKSEKLEPKYPEVCMTTLLYSGNAYTTLRRYDKAYDCYYEARRTAEQNHINPCVSSDYNYYIAMVFYYQKKYAQAAMLFEQSYKLAMANCDSTGRYKIQERISNTALCYTRMHMYDSALYYYSLGINFITQNISEGENEIGAMSALGVIYGNMGDVMLAMHLPDSALKLYSQSVAINNRPKYEIRDAQVTLAKLADLYMERGNMVAAYAILQQLEKSIDTVINVHARLALQKNKHHYYELLHRPEQAYQYYQNYITLRDSVQDANRQLTETDLNQQLSGREQQYHISLLQKDNRFNRLSLWIALGFSSLIVIILALLFINYRRSKTNVLQLTSLNTQVNEQKVQLEFAMQQLQQNMKEKDRIMHVVAHDLRSPIGGIAAVSETLLDKKEGDPAQFEKMVGMIGTAAQHSLNMISELLLLNETVERKKEPADINALVQHSVSFIKHKADKKEQQLLVSLPAEPVVGNVNAEKIMRVIQNLLDNAIKFSHKGGQIELSVQLEKAYVHITVKDQGIGIPDDMKDHIFDAFTTSRRKGTAGERSFGLGLSVCRQIAEAHGGRMLSESSVHGGSSFCLQLPL